MVKKRNVVIDDDPKTRILAAATESFSSVGFAAARVDEIAAQAGVNKAMLYYHFGDKEQLYTAVLTTVVDRAVVALQKAIDGAATPSDKVSAVLETLSRLGEHDPHFVRIMLREIAAGGAGLPDAMLARMAAVFQLVAAVLAEGVGVGAFRPTDPLLTHVSIIGSMMFLIASQPVRARIGKASGVRTTHSYADLARHTANLFLHGLEAPGPKKRSRQR